jgi:hypothetical protein
VPGTIVLLPLTKIQAQIQRQSVRRREPSELQSPPAGCEAILKPTTGSHQEERSQRVGCALILVATPERAAQLDPQPGVASLPVVECQR